MMKIFKKVFPFAVIFLATIVFFWKVVFTGAVALPADLLTGAYYPWYEYKYGYEVGVPIKNALLSDSFSTFYLWKEMIADSYKNFEVPLWNPYSFSGYPLLANFHSGALYILNILFLPFKFATGWNLFMISGILGSCLSMYLLLRIFKYSKGPSLLGSLAYGFSGFSIVWMEFATAGHSLIWLPLLIMTVEKYFQTKKVFWLLLVSPFLFLLSTSGHFQIMIYGYLMLGVYFLYKMFSSVSKRKDILVFVISVILGIGLSLPQLIPTMELAGLSIRFGENYIKGVNYGLIPLRNLITLYAPDFFGNPATRNSWGDFFNYHETLLYIGLPSLIALFWSMFGWKKLDGKERFFLITALISLLFALDTPIGKLIYTFNIPGLSTSAAGRVIAIFTFATSILLATFVQKVNKETLKEIFTKTSILMVFLVTLITTVLIVRFTSLLDGVSFFVPLKQNIETAFRNIILPTLIVSSLYFSFLFKKFKFFPFMFGAILIFDLFRFGWKYTTFVPEKLVFPDTEVTNFLKSQEGVFRVDKQYGPVLPPNTWAHYGLMSPSGYDPMAVESYVSSFYRNINGSGDTTSRYAEVNKYDSKRLGDYNVKYLVFLKKDLPEKEELTQSWKMVFETAEVVILENSDLENRIFLLSDSSGEKTGTSIINKYSSNSVSINYQSEEPAKLILLDSWYPGWNASVNGNSVQVDKYNNVFRSVAVPSGSGDVVFEYKPRGFQTGLIFSTITGVIWLAILLKSRG